jgi:hypothetical protein
VLSFREGSVSLLWSFHMTATRSDCSTKRPALYLAFELSWCEWKLAFTIGHGQSPRLRCLRNRKRCQTPIDIRMSIGV